MSTDFEGWGPQSECFYVHTLCQRTNRLLALAPGTCAAFCSTMARLDVDALAEGTRVNMPQPFSNYVSYRLQNYYIWALEFLPGEFPKRSECVNIVRCERSRSLKMGISTSAAHRLQPLSPLCSLHHAPLPAVIRTLGVRALALTEYEKEFFSTREESCGEQSFYTFKNLVGSSGASLERRERLERFSPVVFGEIQDVYEMNDSRIGILLGCPTNATCDAQDLFARQVATIAVDNDNIISCYAPSNDSMGRLRKHYLAPESRGKILWCTVNLDRSDYLEEDGTKKSYDMWAVDLRTKKQEVGEHPLLGPGQKRKTPINAVAIRSLSNPIKYACSKCLFFVFSHMAYFDYSRYDANICHGFDPREPLLSVYNDAAICILEGCPYDAHWASILSTIDVVSLFKLSLRSEWLFKIVMSHVRACQPSCSNPLQENILPDHMGGPKDCLSTLPVELLSIILPELVLGDRLALSRTSRKFRALCARELQTCVRDMLTRFSLCHAEIRFMQTATNAIICGQCIPHLIDYSFVPAHLDFVTPNVTYSSVLRFFELATGSQPRGAILNNLYSPEGTDDSAKFGGNCSAYFIRVSRSITDNALDSVTYSPFSHLFGAVTHYGVWLAYAQTSTQGTTMPNHDCLDFADPATEDRIESNFRLLLTHFKVDLNLGRVHECGRTWECPMTPRTTVDDGCISLFFPNLPTGHTAQPLNVYPAKTSMHWSLGGRCCPWGLNHILEKVDMSCWQLRLRFDSYARWKRQFEQVLRSAVSIPSSPA
ncbi:hypothetical protein C8F04DRAFT_1179540 [Mycena alexandri]|uniref:F-box domain-containing protein n=1 Tax=Mycena alexandri TaxID=1745969 RepID=A0AAD6T2F4_9AGAR|nr:hypothetical protein C8F04DRAFT_1179540 [Mycena alexandri]